MQQSRKSIMNAEICVRTVTFHALVYQPVQEGAAVVAEGGAGVSVDLKLVFTTRILQGKKNRGDTNDVCHNKTGGFKNAVCPAF